MNKDRLKKISGSIIIISALLGLFISVLGIIQKNLIVSAVAISLGMLVMISGMYFSTNLLHQHSDDHFFNTKEKIFMTTIFLFVVSFPLSFAILHLGRDIADSNPSLKIGTADGWLTLIGSVIGGAITMLALIFTINDSNETKREMLKMNKRRHSSNFSRKNIHHFRK